MILKSTCFDVFLNISEIERFEKRNIDIAGRGIEQYMSAYSKKKDIYKPSYVSSFQRMIEYGDEHLQFIKDFRIPYTNNAAKRQCCVIKTNKKALGQFVSETGLESYTKILTILHTSKMRKENALKNLEKLFS